MFERFTDRARTSVVLAQEEARLLGHEYIGTEHILLGLLREGEGVGAKVLVAMGVRLDTVRADVEEIIGRGAEAPPPGHIPFTPRAKKVLELSLREALHLGHNYIGTEHILLGILREGEGVAAQVLVKYKDVTLETVRMRVVEHLGTASTTGKGAFTAPQLRTPATEGVLRAAERLAGQAPLGSHHLLVSLIQAEGSMAARALAALGVEPAAVESKLSELHVEETTDVTPEEAAARQMELQIEGEEVHLVLRDAATLERARRLVERAGGPVTGDRAFAAVWAELQTSLARIEATLADERTGKPRRTRRRKPPRRQAG
jgi:ATP-dependent Clp protease ATP-binding subunit ClpA